MPDPQVITGTIASPGRLDKALAEASGLSRERVKTLIADGAVSIGDTIAHNGSAKIAADVAFSITLPPPEPLEAEPQRPFPRLAPPSPACQAAAPDA